MGNHYRKKAEIWKTRCPLLLYPASRRYAAWQCVLAARQHSENSSRCLFLQTIILIFAPIENLYLQIK